jgi:type IV pilus assembly protein PilN
MIRINLLPVREERRKAGARNLALVLVAALGGSVLLSAALHGKVRHDISSTRRLAVETQKEIDRFAPQLKQVEEFKKTKAEIEQKLNVIQGLNEARSGPVRMLDELATHTPDRIWISKIEVHASRMLMEGMSLDNELVALFLTALEESPYFKDVELVETQAKEKDGFRLNAFEVSAVLTSPEAEKRASEAPAPAAPAPAAPAAPGKGKRGKTAQAGASVAGPAR